MKVKIKDKIYDSMAEDSPMMIVLTEQDKKNIANMIPEATKYCIYQSEQYTVDEIYKWMEEV